jgi:hypothetical protein
MKGLFDFLSVTCIRCETDKKLMKITDDVWMCIECLKQSKYKSFWNMLTTRVIEICDQRKDSNATYEVLMEEAGGILNKKILLDSGLLTQEEFDERTKHFFADVDRGAVAK